MVADILIAGDCGPTHGPDQGFSIERYTQLVLPVLQTADFRFVNCMRTYSTHATPNSDAPQVGQPIAMAGTTTILITYHHTDYIMLFKISQGSLWHITC